MNKILTWPEESQTIIRYGGHFTNCILRDNKVKNKSPKMKKSKQSKKQSHDYKTAKKRKAFSEKHSFTRNRHSNIWLIKMSD